VQGVTTKKHKSNEQQKDTRHPAKSVMIEVEFQLYPHGSTADLLNIFHVAKAHLEQAVVMANVRSYAANYDLGAVAAVRHAGAARSAGP